MTDTPQTPPAQKPADEADDDAPLFAGPDPFALAAAWLAEASASEPRDANAMALATADASGAPDVRMVLLKEIEPSGVQPDGRGAFVFYTNYESAKGAHLAANPTAALVLHWKSLDRQVRARGRVERVPAEQSDAYFATRPYQSRIGAWASAQSRPLESRGALLAEAARVAARHPISPPRPPHWGGFRVIPSQMEFWAQGAFRLHDRRRWRWTGAGWEQTRLCP